LTSQPAIWEKEDHPVLTHVPKSDQTQGNLSAPDPDGVGVGKKKSTGIDRSRREESIPVVFSTQLDTYPSVPMPKLLDNFIFFKKRYFWISQNICMCDHPQPGGVYKNHPLSQTHHPVG
jgi:hypothetical protein